MLRLQELLVVALLTGIAPAMADTSATNAPARADPSTNSGSPLRPDTQHATRDTRLPAVALAKAGHAITRSSLTQLEQRLVEIDSELERLARYSLRGRIGSVGFKSEEHANPAHTEWIRVELGQDIPIDRIVLVPTIWRDTMEEFQADAFPLEFHIVAGTSRDTNGTMVASFGPQDRLLPRVAPLVVPCPGTIASWVRVEATTLSAHGLGEKYCLQLSEILVFSGPKNVALQQPVKRSSRKAGPGGMRWAPKYVVDGCVPYLMDARQGDQSIAFEGSVAKRGQATLTIDLGTNLPLDRLHLHTADLENTVPPSYHAEYGMPRGFVVEGATRADFSDAVRLIDYSRKSVYDIAPIMMRRFPRTSCRYVRLIARAPYPASGSSRGSTIAFAEIEIFSECRNVALGRPVSCDFEPLVNSSLSALTDGLNFYGLILPVRDWLEELALRHDLETERPLVVAELNRRYARQKVNLNRMIWLATLLATGAVIIVLIDRIIRQRAIYRTRERIAADMHDELGADIHAIGLLSDLAGAAAESPAKLRKLLSSMRALTERTGVAVRHCANLLEAKGLYENLPEDMRRASTRIMADLDHEISFEGESLLHRISPRERIGLILFYRECLINVLRHSGATRASTRLTANNRELCLTVTDNGQGLADSSGNGIPPSLKRRARLLRAQVQVEQPKPGGTCVTLTLRTRRLGVLK